MMKKVTSIIYIIILSLYAFMITHFEKNPPNYLKTKGHEIDTSSYYSYDEFVIGQKIKVKDFSIKTFEVTQDEWIKIMGPHDFYDFKECGGKCPAAYIDWIDAVVYSNKVSIKEGLKECYVIKEGIVSWPDRNCEGYRLPTVSEWMIAAGDFNASEKNAILEYNNWVYYPTSSYCEQYIEHISAAIKYRCGINTVGHLKPNKNGLYDIYGNVHEWTWGIISYKKDKKQYIDELVESINFKENVIITKGCDFLTPEKECNSKHVWGRAPGGITNVSGLRLVKNIKF